MKKHRLLLVNDEEPLQEIFAACLAETGWQIEPALNGGEALRLYRKRGSYDLVLTDIQHPGPDGIELLKRIRKTNPAQAIAVVAALCSRSAIYPASFQDSNATASLYAGRVRKAGGILRKATVESVVRRW
jgi:CheY-like chemotaxis protein